MAIVGLATAVTLALVFLRWNDVDLSVYRVSFFTMAYAWPVVVGVWIVSGADRRWGWIALGIYFAPLWAAGMIGGIGPLDPLRQWVWSLIPTAAILFFLTRPLRGVGTLVLGTMMIGVVGCQTIALWVLASESRALLWVEVTSALGLDDAVLAFIALQLGAFLAAMVLGVIVVRLLAGWYARQGFSDQMLLLGSAFLVFTIDTAVTIDTSDFGAFWLGMGVYVLFGVVALLLCRLVHRKPPAGPSLLMLRVFSPHRGSGRLLDRVSARWRYGADQDDRRPRPGDGQRRAGRVPPVRRRGIARDVHRLIGSTGAADRDPAYPPRPGCPSSRRRAVLFRRHLASQRPRPPLPDRCGADGPPGLRPGEPAASTRSRCSPAIRH